MTILVSVSAIPQRGGLQRNARQRHDGWLFNSFAGAGSTRTEEQISAERNLSMKYLNTEGKGIHWDFIRAVLASVGQYGDCAIAGCARTWNRSAYESAQQLEWQLDLAI